MRKLLLTAAVAVFGLSNINAQEISFGAKAGVNLANLSGDIEDNKMLTGFHVGGVAEYMFDDEMGLQVELLYSTQGTKSSYSESETIGGVTYKYDGEVKSKLDYINIPVLFKYYVSEGLSLEAGPQVGFLLSAKNEYKETETIDGVSTSESETDDLKEYVNSLDFGLNIGLGYKMESGLNFGARYNLGLANINKDDDGDDEKLNHSVFQLSVGFMF